MKRILIVDDHEVVRDGVKRIFERIIDEMRKVQRERMARETDGEPA